MIDKLQVAEFVKSVKQRTTFNRATLSLNNTIDSIRVRFVRIAEKRLEELNKKVEKDEGYLESLSEGYDRIKNYLRKNKESLKSCQEELKNTPERYSYEIRQLNGKIAELENRIKIQTESLSEFPKRLQIAEEQLSESIDLKKTADILIKKVSIGKLTASDKKVFSAIFLKRSSSLYINLKAIAEDWKLTDVFLSLPNDIAEYLLLCFNHYYDIKTMYQLVQAILEGVKINTNLNSYFTSTVIEGLMDTSEFEAYLNKYYPTYNAVSSIPEEYIQAYISVLIFELTISGEIDEEEDSKRDIYHYCSSIIKNPKSRMEFWKETCALDVLNYKQRNTLDKMLRTQPALFKNSTSALLKELDNYINKHF